MCLGPPHLEGNGADVSVNEGGLVSVAHGWMDGWTNYSSFPVDPVFWLGLRWSCSSVTADSRAGINSCKSN